ncbi:hypothetical protein FDI21_gp224 [Pseudomonas phage Noxifer]|uniref:Uncharacterized protein n=1 Tax=Pseudomonas phage Noxifer TaxID=2006684 RepID=A0A1Y0T3L1_9CAUD|nr:hypothetical protein FDI21_gp224 [Pseudomonas phage Noxifer]ARV77487.1 hypothetical protein NOXIFER_322 [Pseudomonas phage Noxifer]
MMLKNKDDKTYEGEAAITNVYNDLGDEVLRDLWCTNTFDANDILTIHSPTDPLGRVWTLKYDDLSVTRFCALPRQLTDLVFYGSDVAHGIYTFMQGHGEDPLLKVMADGVIWEPGDVFTIHYDSERKLQPWWTLETADNLLFKKPAPYPEKP